MYNVYAEQAEERELRLRGTYDHLYEATNSFSHYMQMGAQHAEYTRVRLVTNDDRILAMYDDRGLVDGR